MNDDYLAALPSGHELADYRIEKVIGCGRGLFTTYLLRTTDGAADANESRA